MPDVKEQLLKIVSHTEPMDAMDELLENLRCDRCKHWSPPSRDGFVGAMCELFSDSSTPTQPSGRFPKTYNSGEYGDDGRLYVDPDFFCAAWEAKGA